MYIKQLIEKSRVNSKNLEKLQDNEKDYLLTIHQDLFCAAFIYLKHNKGSTFPNQKCPICNKELSIANLRHQFNVQNISCCSKECQYKQAENTIIQKYGQKEKFLNLIKEKAKQTNIERYGCNFYTETKEFREKSKQTCLQNYGVDNPNKQNMVKNKIRQTCLRKYGVEQNLNLIHINPVQKFELSVLQFLKSIFNGKIETSKWSLIRKYQLDIYIPELKLAIECNGDYWHQKNYLKDKCFKQLQKTNLCEQQGIRLIHIWEHEWHSNKEFIQSLLKLYVENKVHQNEFQKLLKQFGNLLPRDYFQILDFPGKIEEPKEEIINNKQIYKSGYILL